MTQAISWGASLPRAGRSYLGRLRFPAGWAVLFGPPPTSLGRLRLRDFVTIPYPELPPNSEVNDHLFLPNTVFRMRAATNSTIGVVNRHAKTAKIGHQARSELWRVVVSK